MLCSFSYDTLHNNSNSIGWVRVGIGYEMVWVRVGRPSRYELVRVRVGLGTSWHGTTWLGYELTGTRLFIVSNLL